MNELIREIEDDIRRDKLNALWHSFGRLMVAASVGIVLATAAYVIYQNHRQDRMAKQTSRFIKGFDRLGVEDYKGAAAVFGELSADTSSPYYPLAMLRLAQAQEADGDGKAAEKTYRILAQSPSDWAPVAAMAAPEAGKEPPAPAHDSPFYYTQTEWNGWTLLQQGKRGEALKLFASLRDDPQAPASLRRRMQEALQHLAPGSAMKDDQMKDE